MIDLPEGFIYGGDYNPEQWLDEPGIIEKDIELMKKAGVNCVTLGVFSWAALERYEGHYSFDWLDKIIHTLYDNGIYTVLATPSGAKPVWLAKKYPQTLRVEKNGVRENYRGRHNHCMQSKIYRQKVGKIVTRLAERFGSDPAVILWHISNEFGGECYCDTCATAFREWLKKRYGTIERLNHEWWTAFWSHSFTSFDQIDPPYENGEYSIMGLLLDWRRFTTWSTLDYMKSEIDIIRKYSPDKPVTTNFMGCYDGLDYAELNEPLDVISFDSYPTWGNDSEPLWHTAAAASFDYAQMRGYRKQQPFLLMENTPCQTNWKAVNKLKRPGLQIMAGLQAVACGSDSVQYFQWRKSRGSMEQYHGAVVDHSGRDDTRVFKEVARLGEILESLKEIKGTSSFAKTAVIYDTQVRWAIDGMVGFRKYDMRYLENCQRWYRALLRYGIEADVVSTKDDLSDYSLVIAPMLYMTDDALNDKIRAFVKNGGVFAATHLTGYVNENTLNYLGGFPGELTDVFGIRNDETDALYPNDKNDLDISGRKYPIGGICELLTLAGAEELGTYDSDFYAGTPAFTVNSFGKGRAYYIAAELDDDGAQKVISSMFEKEKIKLSPLPEGIERHVRSGEDVDYVFYFNYSSGRRLVDDQTVEPMSVRIVRRKADGSVSLLF